MGGRADLVNERLRDCFGRQLLCDGEKWDNCALKKNCSANPVLSMAVLLDVSDEEDI